MKKAVVTFTVNEKTGSFRWKLDKDDGFGGMDLLSAIGVVFATNAIENDETIEYLSAMIDYISHKTGKGWRELLEEIYERMEEGIG